MERALLQGERDSEAARLRQEQEAAQQLQEKLSSLDASIRKERDKVSLALSWCPVLRRSPADTFSCPWALWKSIPFGFASWGICLSFRPCGAVGTTALPEEARGWCFRCILASAVPADSLMKVL